MWNAWKNLCFPEITPIQTSSNKCCSKPFKRPKICFKRYDPPLLLTSEPKMVGCLCIGTLISMPGQSVIWTLQNTSTKNIAYLRYVTHNAGGEVFDTIPLVVYPGTTQTYDTTNISDGPYIDIAVTEVLSFPFNCSCVLKRQVYPLFDSKETQLFVFGSCGATIRTTLSTDENNTTFLLFGVGNLFCNAVFRFIYEKSDGSREIASPIRLGPSSYFFFGVPQDNIIRVIVRYRASLPSPLSPPTTNSSTALFQKRNTRSTESTSF
jgi:hypothetical protein